ncbi:carbamate kinase [Lactovum miscens]|nr:carbamate kinase [Lactovum miscens]
MMRRIVVALGGNAILASDPSANAQQLSLENTAEQLMPLVIDKNVELIITHGNGPQVGNLLLQQLGSDSEKNPAMPLDTVGAMTQGQIGYWMGQAFTKAFDKHGLKKPFVSIVTRTVVEATDPAFTHLTKPIGPFYTEEESEKLKSQNPDWQIVEDAGRGYRRVVASPLPVEMLEADVIEPLLNAGALVCVSGGGGIPVIKVERGYQGVEAVIDKDFSAAKLAELVGADELVIFTSGGDVYLNYGKPSQSLLTEVTSSEMNSYINDGYFAEGSMKPKVAAATLFAERTGKIATITSLDNVKNFVKNGAGTRIIGS